jgi:hypothetical protein
VMILQMSMLGGTTINITGTGACSVDAVIETAGTVTGSMPRSSPPIAGPR